ncbi:uncharacterized protein LOC111025270 [Momordica charantia]|uniref:Uncharacterized protein LOC111025270 n=1 Tax=Momordica charantia TaxID=3673 RepID=A0A6J1E0H3_MOMCH|nr:uncharacterized protein LOC111025270 [Momordica charantia]
MGAMIASLRNDNRQQQKGIDWTQNVNALAELAAAYETDLGRTVPVGILPKPSIKAQEAMDTDKQGQPEENWMSPLIKTSPQGKGQTKFAMVAVDYFTKWAKTKALSTITEKKFDDATFREFCKELDIKHICSSPAHQQANGQVEAVNKIIKITLETRSEELIKGLWAEEIPNALWAYRTTPCTSTGETPFSLSFGSEAVVLVEIGLLSPKVE